jgi:hypothetical protein
LGVFWLIHFNTQGSGVMFWLSCVQVPVGSEPIMLSAAEISERDMTIVIIGGAVVASWALTDAFAGAATTSAATSITKPNIALPKWSLLPCDAQTMHATADTTLRSRPASAYPGTVVKIRMERRDVEHKEQHSEQSPSATTCPAVEMASARWRSFSLGYLVGGLRWSAVAVVLPVSAFAHEVAILDDSAHNRSMKDRLRGHGRKSAATIAVTVALLAAFTGLAFAKAGMNTGSQPPASSGDRQGHANHANKHADKPDGNEGPGDDAGGPPPGTHGYEVSKIAHETPPGPGHGRAVSAVARSWAGKKHPKNANHGHGHTADSDSDD